MIDRVRWRGILPSLPTVFDDAGEVDAAGFRAVTRFALDRGAHGLVCFGLAGEVSRLTVAERERLLEVAIDEVDDAIPVVTGATAENLATSQRLARHAERAGAAGVVLPPPTGYRLSEADMLDFLVAVASATELPAIVQDAPEYLEVSLRPEVVVEAARRAPNICAVKLETGAEGMERWRAVLGEGFGVYGGNGGMFLLDCLRASADGIMPGVDTIDLQVAVYAAEQAGEHARADELFARLLPLLVFEMQSIDHYNACAKHVLRRRGVAIGNVELRAPGPRRLEPSSIPRLEHYLQRLGLAAAPSTLEPTGTGG